MKQIILLFSLFIMTCSMGLAQSFQQKQEQITRKLGQTTNQKSSNQSANTVLQNFKQRWAEALQKRKNSWTTTTKMTMMSNSKTVYCLRIHGEDVAVFKDATACTSEIWNLKRQLGLIIDQAYSEAKRAGMPAWTNYTQEKQKLISESFGNYCSCQSRNNPSYRPPATNGFSSSSLNNKPGSSLPQQGGNNKNASLNPNTTQTAPNQPSSPQPTIKNNTGTSPNINQGNSNTVKYIPATDNTINPVGTNNTATTTFETDLLNQYGGKNSNSNSNEMGGGSLGELMAIHETSQQLGTGDSNADFGTFSGMFQSVSQNNQGYAIPEFSYEFLNFTLEPPLENNGGFEYPGKHGKSTPVHLDPEKFNVNTGKDAPWRSGLDDPLPNTIAKGYEEQQLLTGQKKEQEIEKAKRFNLDASKLQKEALEKEYQDEVNNCLKYSINSDCTGRFKPMKENIKIIEEKIKWQENVGSMSKGELEDQKEHYKTFTDMGALAWNSYPDPKKQKESDSAFKASGYHKDASWRDNLSGFDCTLYKKDDGSYVLAFAGTDETIDKGEWFSGVFSPHARKPLIPTPTQTEQALSVVEYLKDNGYPMDKLTLTGHSLGGRLAAEAAIKNGLTAYTFNAAGVSFETKEWIEKNSKWDNAGKIVNIQANDDILTNVQEAASTIVGGKNPYVNNDFVKTGINIVKKEVPALSIVGKDITTVGVQIKIGESTGGHDMGKLYESLVNRKENIQYQIDERRIGSTMDN